MPEGYKIIPRMGRWGLGLSILGYACSTAAGPSTKEFFEGLLGGRDHSQVADAIRVCRRWNASEKFSSALEELTDELVGVWKQIRPAWNGGRLGVILASTKGCVEDFVWENEIAATDPLTPVLNSFLKRSEIKTENTICVSNACASTVGALFLARQWINQNRCENVLVLACDKIGPFVTKGFFSLRALTATRTRPFGAGRDGLQLGEATAALLVSGENESCASPVIRGIGFETEGFAVTRPSTGGDGLLKAAQCALEGKVPDLVIAHGTGTPANDQTEDKVFANLFKNAAVPVTSTKWSVGHTLASSAALDTIAACEILRTGRVFSLANTDRIDPSFSGSYLTPNALRSRDVKRPETPRTVLVSSLGFGGVNGALFIEGGRP